jgi:superfamily II DNA or RNA helicase
MLVVSKVANFAIDLPDANVAIQVSGTFGSRQEEAQRLGRILRPKKDGSIANFYSLVTRDTKDQDFSTNRQLFLTEQGYRYNIVDAADVVPGIVEKLAQLQAEFDEKKLSGDFDVEALIAGRTKVAAEDDGEAKPKRKARAKKSDQPEQPDPGAEITSDLAAGAEDQQPAQRRRGRPPKQPTGREHLRVVK